MSHRDHAQDPLLRRLIRRIPPPAADAVSNVELIDLELSDGVVELTGLHTSTARIMVSIHGQSLGLLDIPCPQGRIPQSVLSGAIHSQLGGLLDDHLRHDGIGSVELAAFNTARPRCLLELEPPSPAPFVTVVIPTRNRSRQLATCLASIQRLAYPSFEVIIVDNAPTDGRTEQTVARIAAVDARIRYLREPLPGASRARNVGMASGRGDIVAFTDDDVEVDRLWLNGLVAGFGSDPTVEVVGGLTLAGQLETAAQRAFELYGGMARGHERRLYDLDRHRGDTLLYPYTAGIFGASNNAAFRRRPFLERGGFDQALGPASPAYSAEDLDAFLAVILAGHKIVYEPRAIVRHEHRREFADLYWQIFTYSAGSSALLTKWALTSSTVAKDLSRRLPGLVPAALLRPQRSGVEAGVGAYPSQVRWLERVGYLYGPIAYVRGRLWARKQARSVAGDPSCPAVVKVAA